MCHEDVGKVLVHPKCLPYTLMMNLIFGTLCAITRLHLVTMEAFTAVYLFCSQYWGVNIGILDSEGGRRFVRLVRGISTPFPMHVCLVARLPTLLCVTIT